ncbi:hypothetical protein EXS71_02770 [Candidatus Uhrbacteria bacterium]|nr:hypothetical protein [Candidatus Uhrbacteria bacterium]
MKFFFIISLLGLVALGFGCATVSSISQPKPAQTENQKMRSALAEGTILRVGDMQSRTYQSTGSARILRLLDQRFVLLLSEDFQIDQGPQPIIVLSANPNPLNFEQAQQGGILDLGPLHALSGGQVYDLSKDLSLDRWHSVVIYSQAEQTLFGVAGLQAS